MNFKKSLAAVAFALSFCFSGIVNVISALDDQYYAPIANQLVGNQAALANLQLIRDWHDRHPLDNPAHARDFVVNNIQGRFQAFAQERNLPDCDWQHWNDFLEKLGSTLIFAVMPSDHGFDEFQNNIIWLCQRVSSNIKKGIEDWDETIEFWAENSRDAELATAHL